MKNEPMKNTEKNVPFTMNTNADTKSAKVINKIVIIAAHIGEVACWIGCGFLVFMLIFSAMGKIEWLSNLSTLTLDTKEATLGGFSIQFLNAAGDPVNGSYVVFCITALLNSALMAMTLRNVHLIFETAAGKTKFSEGATPFQTANVRMVREIGLFVIGINVVNIVMSIIGGFALKGVDTSADLSGIVIGLVVLALSQFFAKGMELQKDVDGLV